MYAYLAPGQTEVKTFKNFIRIDTRGRKFKAVPNTFNYTVPTEVAVNPSWVITGSKGDKYTVEKGDNGYSCTCSGFKFRGACKHVRQVEVATA
jgi:hypothetical protein